jgi:hypothetical protein
MKDLFKIGIYTCVLSIVLNILETAYYGFHKHPSCIEEERWDVALAIFFEIGVCLVIIGFYINKNSKGKHNE